MQLKRLQQKQKHESNKNPPENSGTKKRIKQKSLATIVANNLKAVKSPSILKTNKTEVKPVKPTVTFKTPSIDKSDNKSIDSKPTIKSSKPDKQETLVEFVKPTKDIAPKAIIAKRRVTTNKAPKKSLSQIFTKNAENVESTASKSVFNFPENEPTEIRGGHKTQRGDLRRSTLPGNSGRFDKIKRKFDKDDPRDFGNKRRRANDPGDDGKSSKGHGHSSGKISSLFGSNPEVPKFGQKFVKPVVEAVFTGENFSDLDVHAYMVRMNSFCLKYNKNYRFVFNVK